MLPAYCDPPNPCPIGYTEADGCIEDFENTSDFSRQYQVKKLYIDLGLGYEPNPNFELLVPAKL